MLVVVAAGNEGDKTWHYITSPADADSILTVGAIDVLTNEIAKFSSWGPTADGRVKPEVCAVGKGTALINPIDNSVVFGNGTSFACPIIAGMAACLWSALPDASNMEIRERIIQSSSLYNTPHDQYGYGIPDVWQAYNNTNSASPHIETKPSAEKILIDGATGLKRELYVTIPLVKPTIKTVTTMAATSGFLLYNEVFFLTNGAAGTKSISFIIRELAITSSRTQYARANTIGAVQIVIGLILVGLINIIFSESKESQRGGKA